MFTTPQELVARGEAEILNSSLNSARAYAQSCLNRGSRECDGVIRMGFHSTHHAAVQVVASELTASGWRIVDSRIKPGYYSHYLHVTRA